MITQSSADLRTFRDRLCPWNFVADDPKVSREHVFEVVKVKMHSMIGPDEAFQIQTQEVLYDTPNFTVIRTRIQTIDFPYSDTFLIDQM